MIEPIGLVTLLLCLAAFYAPLRFGICCFVLAMLLGAASALTLGGSGNIQPAHVILGPVAILVARQRQFASDLERAVRFPSAGFWLLLYVSYGVVCSMILPRLFEGATVIMSIGSTKFGGNSPIPVPLTSTTGNINQSVYIISDLICFVAVYSFIASRENAIFLCKTFLAFSFGDIVFAAADYLTSITNTGFILDPIRNADYDLHLEESVGGLRRIVGSFTETSLFSFHTVGSFAFCFSLFLSGRWKNITGFLSAILLFLLLASTSGTAYLALAPVLIAFYIFCLYQAMLEKCSAPMVFVLIGAPVICIGATLFVMINEPIYRSISEFVDIAVFSKAQSPSGVERSSWNRIGMENFYATYGLGSGLGTTRVSSWLVAVLASTGVPGAILMVLFFKYCFVRDLSNDKLINDIARAARFCCFGYLVAGSLSFSLVDLKLPFFAMAALAVVDPRTGLLTLSNSKSRSFESVGAHSSRSLGAPNFASAAHSGDSSS